jgi:hypothetical protein
MPDFPAVSALFVAIPLFIYAGTTWLMRIPLFLKIVLSLLRLTTGVLYFVYWSVPIDLTIRSNQSRAALGILFTASLFLEIFEAVHCHYQRKLHKKVVDSLGGLVDQVAK